MRAGFSRVSLFSCCACVTLFALYVFESKGKGSGTFRSSHRNRDRRCAGIRIHSRCRAGDGGVCAVFSIGRFRYRLNSSVGVDSKDFTGVSGSLVGVQFPGQCVSGCFSVRRHSAYGKGGINLNGAGCVCRVRENPFTAVKYKFVDPVSDGVCRNIPHYGLVHNRMRVWVAGHKQFRLLHRIRMGERHMDNRTDYRDLLGDAGDHLYIACRAGTAGSV